MVGPGLFLLYPSLQEEAQCPAPVSQINRPPATTAQVLSLGPLSQPEAGQVCQLQKHLSRCPVSCLHPLPFPTSHWAASGLLPSS
jgi:hypothetical protein